VPEIGSATAHRIPQQHSDVFRWAHDRSSNPTPGNCVCCYCTTTGG